MTLACYSTPESGSTRIEPLVPFDPWRDASFRYSKMTGERQTSEIAVLALRNARQRWVRGLGRQRIRRWCGRGVLGIGASAIFAIGCASSDAGSRTRTPNDAMHRGSAHQAEGTATINSDTNGGSDPFESLEHRFAEAQPRERQVGSASYYADSLAGRAMANGQIYDPQRATMAHRSLPFGTIVRVVRVSTGASVVVEVTDRGPFGSRRRIADLSGEAARRLDMLRAGVVDVRLEILQRGEKKKRR